MAERAVKSWMYRVCELDSLSLCGLAWTYRVVQSGEWPVCSVCTLQECEDWTALWITMHILYRLPYCISSMNCTKGHPPDVVTQRFADIVKGKLTDQEPYRMKVTYTILDINIILYLKYNTQSIKKLLQ